MNMTIYHSETDIAARMYATFVITKRSVKPFTYL